MPANLFNRKDIVTGPKRTVDVRRDDVKALAARILIAELQHLCAVQYCGRGSGSRDVERCLGGNCTGGKVGAKIVWSSLVVLAADGRLVGGIERGRVVFCPDELLWKKLCFMGLQC